MPSTVLGNRPPEEGLSLLLRSFLGEEEAQTEECSHNVLSAAKETSQGHWTDSQEGGSPRGAGWVGELVRGGAQRPWKQVERRVAGQEEGHRGRAVREAKARGHPGVPRVIPWSTTDRGCGVDASHARRWVPPASTRCGSPSSCPGEVTVGTQLTPQLLSFAAVTPGHILHVARRGAGGVELQVPENTCSFLVPTFSLLPPGPPPT